MNKAALIDVVHEKLGDAVARSQAEKAVDAVFSAIKESIQEAGHQIDGDGAEQVALQLVGFGTFSVVQRAARMGVNPQDPSKKIPIKASKAVKFKPGQGLKTLLN